MTKFFHSDPALPTAELGIAVNKAFITAKSADQYDGENGRVLEITDRIANCLCDSSCLVTELYYPSNCLQRV